jgi:hypothetical protein
LDGAVINAYFGISQVVANHIRTLDEHGNGSKNVWLEESAAQHAPYEEDGRRYGEAAAVRQMARVWLSLMALYPSRLKTITSWGFISGQDSEIMMVTSRLQPRPQFVAQAVLADALADAQFLRNDSQGQAMVFSWQRSDDELMTAWADAGECDLTLRTSGEGIRVVDLMGNQKQRQPKNGLVRIHLDEFPIFISSRSAMSVSR